MYEQHMDAPHSTRTDQGALQAIDYEVERLGKAIDALNQRLSPVMNRYQGEKVEQEMASPIAEPSSELRARAQHLAGLIYQIEVLTRSIDL